MKLLPGEPLAPFRRLPDRFRVDAVLGAEQLDVGVGGHLAQNLRHVLRAFHVHGAPPEGRLRAPERREPAVVAEHAAYLGVVPEGVVLGIAADEELGFVAAFKNDLYNENLTLTMIAGQNPFAEGETQLQMTRSYD